MPPKPIEILLVEDHFPDVVLTKRAFSNAKVSNIINHVLDGVEAMAYLRKEGKYANMETPDVVLLDLNMPRKDGKEVLNEIQEDAALKKIPVIVLTTSSAEGDILKSYNLGANAYIVKPVDFASFIQAVATFENFWFTLVKLPA